MSSFIIQILSIFTFTRFVYTIFPVIKDKYDYKRYNTRNNNISEF